MAGRWTFDLGKQLNNGIYHLVGFLPKNYIRSGAFSKSKRTVSPRDTGLIPEDRENPLHDNPIIST
ncbi:MAG: hypothetical protein J6Y71_03085 [Ruminococcus sp.]|nr:hypothetical protein [Ruminococcus sp.]